MNLIFIHMCPLYPLLYMKFALVQIDFYITFILHVIGMKTYLTPYNFSLPYSLKKLFLLCFTYFCILFDSTHTTNMT